MRKHARGPVVALCVLGMLAVLLTACGGTVATRAVEERPTVSEYKGWTISVTPARLDTSRWRARVRVWPPEVRPESHPGINLTFSEIFGDRRAVEQAGTAAARQYIDASQPVQRP